MAYEFNGTTQNLSMGSFPVSGPPLTIAGWFNANNITQGCFIAGVSEGSRYFAIAATGDIAGDPVSTVEFDGSAVKIASTTTGYTANTWTHAAGVWTSLSNRTAYINGGSSGSNAATSNATTLTSAHIGANAAISSNRMNGRIAEVGVWNVALTAAEVASLAKGMTCDKIRPQNLVFYAPLIRDLIDQKGGLTITNNNGATVATHPRVYA